METLIRHQVKEIQWPGKTFITKREKVGFDDLQKFFTEAYGTIYGHLMQTGIRSTEMPCAIYFSIDESTQQTDVAAAVPVNDSVKETEGFQQVTIPKSKALFVTHHGPYEEMGPAYAALEEYISEHKLQKLWMIEEYYSDPAVETDPSKWKTNIYFIVN